MRQLWQAFQRGHELLMLLGHLNLFQRGYLLPFLLFWFALLADRSQKHVIQIAVNLLFANALL